MPIYIELTCDAMGCTRSELWHRFSDTIDNTVIISTPAVKVPDGWGWYDGCLLCPACLKKCGGDVCPTCGRRGED